MRRPFKVLFLVVALLLVGFALRLSDDFHGRVQTDSSGQTPTRSSGGRPGNSNLRDRHHEKTEPAPTEIRSHYPVGGFTPTAAVASKTSEQRSSKEMSIERRKEVRMFFVKSSEIDIPENTNPEGLGEILKEVLAHLKLDDPTMVLDADLHNGSDSPFLLHGESSLDLTEEINKWLRSNRRLTEPSPDLSLLPAP